MNHVRNFPFMLLIILALILSAGSRSAVAGEGRPANLTICPRACGWTAGLTSASRRRQEAFPGCVRP